MMFRILAVLVTLFAVYVGFMGYSLYQTHAARSAIFEAPADAVFGPEDGDVTVIKFMDYACVHCREIHPVLMQAIMEDGNVRLIIRPLPSPSSDGSIAARLVYAAGILGKFKEAHEYIMTNFGTMDEVYFETIAKELGSDIATLNAAFEKDESAAAVWDNKSLFDALGGSVTPTFFIGPETIFIPHDGMPSVTEFKDMFNNARGSAS